MTMHRIEFSYMIPEYGVLEIDLDPEDIDYRAIQEIQTVFPDVEDIEITKIEEL